MCSPAAIPYVIAAVTTVAQGVQAREEGLHQKALSRYNARNLENQATQVRNKGAREENLQRRATAETLSRQQAQLAASNLDLDVGSALSLQEDVVTLGEVDALTIRENTDIQASATEEQARLTLKEGNRAATKGRRAFQTSLLIGGLQAAGGAAVGTAPPPATTPGAVNTSVSSKWYTNQSSAARVSGSQQLLS